ncbi:hypothetical protein CEP51_015177 [Fusarium floridanum]|uniref:Uncharacterized protein n=1 Tax=Fusarium floridanum TaxID=1325733 RepID=A0A428PF03_9HYPO|nr:hypothetical protein CEP51_015177 [Fusarium floridanum]
MFPAQLTIEGLLSLLGDKIIDFLNTGANQHSEIKACSIARSINQLLREVWQREGENEDKIRKFLWRLWNLIISIASRTQHDDERLDMLVMILKRLRDIRSDLTLLSFGMAQVWGDMPLLGECLREAANSSFMTAPSSSPAKWISLQSLFAHLYGQGITQRTDLAIWVLRDGLEEELPPPGSAHDAMLEGITETLTEPEILLLRVGKLAVGMEPGVTEDRWAFWLQRLRFLGEQSNWGMRQKVEDAVRVMIRLEEEQAWRKAQELKQIRHQLVHDWLAGVDP